MSNITIKIESWDDWGNFSALTRKLCALEREQIYPRGALTNLAKWLSTRKITVRCRKCGWTGSKNECPQCKEDAAIQGFELIPATFEITVFEIVFTNLALALDKEPTKNQSLKGGSSHV